MTAECASAKCCRMASIDLATPPPMDRWARSSRSTWIGNCAATRIGCAVCGRTSSAVFRSHFDGDDLVAFMHHRKGQAAVHAAAIDVDGAGAALAVIATLLRAGEMDAFAQSVEQRGAGVECGRGYIPCRSPAD